MRSRLLAALAGSAITVAAGVGVMAATGTGFANGSGTITACVKAVTGQVRIVSAGASCTPAETLMTWNQQGPQGLQGEQGPAGPSVTFTRRTNSGTIDAHDWSAVYSFCQAGEVVVGGGYEVASIGLDYQINQDEPITVDGVDGWMIALHNGGDIGFTVGVSAICAQNPA